ncbi:MAG: hypothetical protein RLZZ74_2771 [Cyanobacteriota bacterium]|jgi:hypothetical protein
MNLYSAAIISTGLSWILINNCTIDQAIAKQAPDNSINTCNQINNQALTPSAPILADQIVDHRNLVASTKATLDKTQSSFWWAALQFDPFDGKLVQNWLAYPQKQQINLIVNWQLWTLLDYFGRYRFVNQFGTVARKYGYSLNIFNQEDQCLASYKYNSTSIPPKWELNLEQLGRSSLPIEPVQQPSIIEVP